MNRNAPPLANDLNGLFLQSKQCIGRYDFQGAVDVLHRAHRLEPANDKILVDLGSACAKSYDFVAAQRWFDEAVRVSPTRGAVLNAAGHGWLEVRNYEAAQGCFERVLQEEQVPLVTFIRLSEIYIRRRRLEEAAQMAERALRLYGPVDGALLARANVHRQMGQSTGRKGCLERLWRNPRVIPRCALLPGTSWRRCTITTGTMTRPCPRCLKPRR